MIGFGRNSEGQLGDPESKADVTEPKQIKTVNKNKKVVQVSCGWGHTIALTDNSEGMKNREEDGDIEERLI